MAETLVTSRPDKVLILGCGFTGQRVARLLLASGVAVVATSRDAATLNAIAALGAETLSFDALDPLQLATLPRIASRCDAIVCSIPTLRVGKSLVEQVPNIVASLHSSSPRFLYLSTTGVYGPQRTVDEFTQPQPHTERAQLRVDAENAVLSTFHSALVLRPAAIYGPGRGVHVSLREGRYRLSGDGSNYISRIHVDDLAGHIVAAISSQVTGAWPVADEYPCSQREMAEFCAELIGVALPDTADPAVLSETLRGNREVDGSAIRRILGIGLRYPSYKEGVPASMAAEGRMSGREK